MPLLQLLEQLFCAYVCAGKNVSTCGPPWYELVQKCSASPPLPSSPPPTYGRRSLSPPPLGRPQSANQTGENELKSSLVLKRCGCLEQVHESRPKRNPADFKYKHSRSAVKPSFPLLPQAVKHTAVCEMRTRAFGLFNSATFPVSNRQGRTTVRS